LKYTSSGLNGRCTALPCGYHPCWIAGLPDNADQHGVRSCSALELLKIENEAYLVQKSNSTAI